MEFIHWLFPQVAYNNIQQCTSNDGPDSDFEEEYEGDGFLKMANFMSRQFKKKHRHSSETTFIFLSLIFWKRIQALSFTFNQTPSLLSREAGNYLNWNFLL